MDKVVDDLAQILWDYHQMNHNLQKADCIFVLGNTDERTIERGIELYHQGFAKQMVIAGGFGKITSKIWKEPEAEKFAKIAMQAAVPKESILLETRSTNTGENIQFVRALLKEKGIEYHSFIVVTKPYMERRAYATFKKNWAEKAIQVSSLQVSYTNYIQNGKDPKERIINLMVGDLQRIRIYPKKGFQIAQAIPDTVWSAYERLVALGFDKQVIKDID